MSLPAIMKHLDVLSDAGLIVRIKTGRTVACQLNADPMQAAMDWLERYQRFWSEQLDRLAAFVEEEIMPTPATIATKPSLALKRRINAPPAKVYEAWTDPAKLARWFGPRRVERAGRGRCPRRRPLSDGRTHGADGEVHEVGGTYREVIANEKLVFTWAWHSTPERESLVTVQLKPDGNGTLLTADTRAILRRACARGVTCPAGPRRSTSSQALFG